MFFFPLVPWKDAVLCVPNDGRALCAPTIFFFSTKGEGAFSPPFSHRPTVQELPLMVFFSLPGRFFTTKPPFSPLPSDLGSFDVFFPPPPKRESHLGPSPGDDRGLSPLRWERVFPPPPGEVTLFYPGPVRQDNLPSLPPLWAHLGAWKGGQSVNLVNDFFP